MAVTSIGRYEFPSRSRQELYGDDQLVHVWWRGNTWFAAAACFRAPRAMAWGEFRQAILDPWASADPDFDPDGPYRWSVDGKPVDPVDDQSLAALGVGHKSLVTFHA